MSQVVIVNYVNAVRRQEEQRSHVVADFKRPTIEALVDLFDAQIGTVLSVYAGDRCLHRSAVRLTDLL